MINGEIVPILEAIEFSSKDELLTKLRDMREATVRLAPADRRVVKQIPDWVPLLYIVRV